MDRKVESEEESLGLAANASFGRWDIAINEALDSEELTLELDGPGVYMVFQLQESNAITKALHFLQAGLGKADPAARPGDENELPLGRFGSAAVSLHWDNEGVPRCFLIIGPSARSTFRLSLEAEDIRSLCDAFEELAKQLPSVASD
jgi:hypothetical protein